jgi:hypothetical protein
MVSTDVKKNTFMKRYREVKEQETEAQQQEEQ